MAISSRFKRIPWKAGLFLAAAIAAVQFLPSPVPARDGFAAAPAPAPELPRFDMTRPAEVAAPAPRAASAPEPAAPPTPAPMPAEPVAVPDYPVHAELPVGRMLEPGEWAWTNGAVPAGGETLIVVNLRAQLLSLYRGGYEIGRARIIYGADEKPTPTGTFPIMEKDVDHHSNLYGWAPMPWMLRLTSDGVSIHGSPEIANDLVTHGCVGLPYPFAKKLFAEVKVGDRVVVWRG